MGWNRNTCNMPTTNYLFIDGAYFDSAIKSISSKYFDVNLEIEYWKLGQYFTRVFYYNCLAPQQVDEKDDEYRIRITPQIKFFNSLKLIPGYHVKLGVVKREKPKKQNEQKQVDIMIAVDMLTHTIRQNMGKAVLLTGDLDFKPLIDALVIEGMYVTLWSNPSTTNEDLIYAADAYEPLTIDKIYHWATDSFQKKHTIPYCSTTNCLSWENDVELIKTGNTESGQEIKLYYGPNYKAWFISVKQEEDKFYDFRYHDIEKLEFYIRGKIGEFKWND